MYVKAKLTLTIEQGLIPEAKRYAQSRGISLSELVERSLAEVTAAERESFTSRWRGKFRPADRDDERYRRLERKYL